MYEGLGLKILGWKSFFSMSVRRTWQLKDYVCDVIGCWNRELLGLKGVINY